MVAPDLEIGEVHPNPGMHEGVRSGAGGLDVHVRSVERRARGAGGAEQAAGDHEQAGQCESVHRSLCVKVSSRSGWRRS